MTVLYEGRASSTCGPANFLFIHKPDGASFIHASNLLSPVNYQRTGSTLKLENNSLTITSKKGDESITMILHHIKDYQEFPDWSKGRPTMKGTEKQLCDKIVDQLPKLLNTSFKEIIRELKTPIGDVDIVGIDINDAWHLIEAKRAKINTNDLYQLKKYFDHLSDGRTCKGYMAAPKISTKAEQLIDGFDFDYLRVEHD